MLKTITKAFAGDAPPDPIEKLKARHAAAVAAREEARNGPAGAPIEGLRAKHGAAVEAVEAARAAFREASLEDELAGDGQAKGATATAARHLAATEARVKELAGAIEAAAARQAKRAASDAAEEMAERWGFAGEYAALRVEAAREVDAAIAALANAYSRLERSSVGLATSCPVPADLDASLFRAGDLNSAFRLAMVRAGFKWAAHWPWGADGIPMVAARITAANEHIAAKRGDL